MSWLPETLIATTLLMALVLAIRAPVRRILGAHATYALWLVPALRFVLPPLDLFPVAPAMDVLAPMRVMIAPAAVAPPAAGAWLLIWIWAAGALAFVGWHTLSYRRFLVRALPLHEHGSVVVAHVDGPAATGLLRPRILVPADFDTRYDATEQRLALLHERTHVARGDLLVNAAALGMLALHWFNPLAYRAHRAFREDQELSCDALVIGGVDREDRAAYGRAMVKSAWGTASPMICPMTRTDNLKRRLSMVKTHRISARRTAAGMAGAAMLSLGGLTLTANGAVAASDPAIKKITVTRTTILGGKKALEAELEKHCGKDMVRTESPTKADAAGTTTKTVRCHSRSGVASTAEGQLSALRAARAEMLTTTVGLDATQRARSVAAIDSAIASLQAD